MAFSYFASDSGSNPSLVMSSRKFSLSNKRMTSFSPKSVGTVDTQLALIGLDVNVAGAALHGVGENQVYQLDDRRLFRGLFQRGQVHFLFFRGQFQVPGIGRAQVLHDPVEF